jgi:hypothetical protein
MNWVSINMFLLAISNLALVFVVSRIRKEFDIMHMQLTCMLGAVLVKEGIITKQESPQNAH